MQDSSFYEYWLSSLSGIGVKKQKHILEYGTAEEIFNMSSTELATIEELTSKDIMTICTNRDYDKIYQEYVGINQAGVKYIGISDELYPDNLRYIYDAPIGLYYKGNIEALRNLRKSVAIVGSRGCTQYGIKIATDMAKMLSNAGVAVISGMALGIDTCAHEGGLVGRGHTFAVLAGGADVCYPITNFDLYNRICSTGGVFSEFPLGLKPQPHMFPVRNRIISGIADAVIVIEARLKSGSLITADMALEQNKNIYVVPGRIGDDLSEGCLWLAKQGAQILTDVREVLNDLGVEQVENLEEENLKISLAPHEKMLYSLMCLFPQNLNTIIEESGLQPHEVTTALLGLELKGLIREAGCHYYCKK